MSSTKTTSYKDMIKTAILTLKERNGSSRQSLKKYVQSNNDVKGNFESLFNSALRKGVASGEFIQPKGPSGPVKLNKSTAPSTETKKPAKKVTKPSTTTAKPKAAKVTKPTTKKATTAPKAKKSATTTTAAAPKKAAPKKAAAAKAVSKKATKAKK
ncbi:hypothetical protein KGF54_005564 [Candida jiufengensis]|uniref:uncharacterized protein n=1 Tax=Candida jiufengensis TaxID=497108 RepID=UPI00222443FB|nr:uncharacterized protein KGF54_005564 [Candida jiufengensis]KAI5949329.1 hypothetical protein KGF54_005564 [Candida jiufengensis]